MIQPAQGDLFAVIGNPVKHSLSPTMMNAAFRSLGIPAVYLALQLDALPGDLDTLWNVGFQGLSVTLPHKEAAFLTAVGVDETARAIGAVNTLRRCAEGWEGFNTDWIGATRALRRVIDPAGKRALVLGAGGGARAVVYGLKREGAEVTVANRTAERGEALAGAMHCAFLPLSELTRCRGGIDAEPAFDILVQCTSVGLAGVPSEPLLPDAFFHSSMTVMDTVYRPFQTPFVRSARKAGSKVVPGSEMLLYQGVAQLEIWLGRSIPESGGAQVMRDALEEVLTHE